MDLNSLIHRLSGKVIDAARLTMRDGGRGGHCVSRSFSRSPPIVPVAMEVRASHTCPLVESYVPDAPRGASGVVAQAASDERGFRPGLEPSSLSSPGG